MSLWCAISLCMESYQISTNRKAFRFSQPFFEDYILLEYAAASLGNRFPIFRMYILPSPSGVLLRTLDPSKSRFYGPSKCREIIPRWSSVISQNAIKCNMILKTGQPEALGHTGLSVRQTDSHRLWLALYKFFIREIEINHFSKLLRVYLVRSQLAVNYSV